ncbi:MAG: T9SS type A sorting domain-containing protein [Bacteroidetes bacterium]|nr:T9SS type A sorting domain-containing protein [Bacteroidota bacterium]
MEQKMAKRMMASGMLPSKYTNIASSWRGTKPSSSWFLLDCFGQNLSKDRKGVSSPLNDGAIVYSARALLRDITGRLIVYSDACSGSGGSARMLKGETTRGYILLPNPNHGQFELQQLTASSEPVHIEVLDVLGRATYSKMVSFKSGKTKINLGDAVPGVYLLRLMSGRSTNYFKFLVQ